MGDKGNHLPPSIASLTKDKLEVFSTGDYSKTKYDKIKEEKERKKKEEEEAAAKAYAEFLESFSTDNSKTKTFVRGETIVPLSERNKIPGGAPKTVEGGFAVVKDQPTDGPRELYKMSAPAPSASTKPKVGGFSMSLGPAKPKMSNFKSPFAQMPEEVEEDEPRSDKRQPAPTLQDSRDRESSGRESRERESSDRDRDRHHRDRDDDHHHRDSRDREKDRHSEGRDSSPGPSGQQQQQQPKKGMSSLAMGLAKLEGTLKEPPKREEAKPKKMIDSFLEELKNKYSHDAPSGKSTSGGDNSPPTNTNQEGLLNKPMSSALMGQPIISGGGVPPPFGGSGSYDSGDPTTTNLYVGNLSPHVTEDLLMREFGKFGAIASVKIMWPRKEEERKRGRNSGFVCFMVRDEAAMAKQALDGTDILGFEVRIGWGKAIPVPPEPIYVPPHYNKGGMAASASSRSSDVKEDSQSVELKKIEVKIPKDKQVRFLADRLAMFVGTEGYQFEQQILERERDNPKFSFIYDASSPDYIYYKWKVYSISQGDTVEKWRGLPFLMFIGGPYWIPPPCKSPIEEQMDEEQERKRRRVKGALTDEDRDDFEDMLRHVDLKRDTIQEIMVFALDHADANNEIVEVMTESLTLRETPLEVKIARLFAVSDILYNSSAQVMHAANYRTGFGKSLSQIFTSIYESIKDIPGRMTAKSHEDKVLRVIRAWERWSLFSQDFLQNLTDIIRTGSESNPNARM